jgi:hypothetical protein
MLAWLNNGDQFDAVMNYRWADAGTSVMPSHASTGAAPLHSSVVVSAFTSILSAGKTNTPEFAFFRPYTPDLLGWFDDFSHSGVYDALGAASRNAASCQRHSCSASR